MAKSNVGIGIDPTILVVAAGGIALVYFGVLNPLLETIGLKDSKEDKQEKGGINTAEGSQGWNPNFHLTYRPSGVKICLMVDSKATRLANQIDDAWGIFNDNEEQIFAAFRELRSAVQLSQLCAKYSQLHKQDLLTRCRGGLSDAEFYEVAKIVNKLPVNATTC